MNNLIMIGILLLIAGFILVGIEMIIPGFGAPGISGIVCLIGGILLTAKRQRRLYGERLTERFSSGKIKMIYQKKYMKIYLLI